jgi:hypothetical protein
LNQKQFHHKKIPFIISLTALTICVKAQQTIVKPTDTAKLYNPAADAKAEMPMP